MNQETEKYFKDFEREVKKVYAVANEARGKGLDPVDKVEIPLAMSMAEKVVGLIGTIYPQMENSGIDKRILELEKEFGKLDPTVVFKIAEEVAKQKFCEFSSLVEAIDAGIRIGFAYITLGVVSSPIEGFTGLKLGKTRQGKDYFIANFSGPIRSAGTTASCIVLMLIDYLRELFGFEKYDPTEDEIKRVYAELEHFHDRITNLQYMPTEEEALFLARNLPIQVAGDASEKLEVPNYKNLERVDTDFLRSGVCLVLAEGLAQKAAKGFRLLGMAKKNGIKSTGFDFLEEYIELHEKASSGKSSGDSTPVYIKDLVAGRPVFGHPSKSGGFRFRYGRGRTSGFSAVSLHPATMQVTDGFIAQGTQLKIEKPTKGCAVTSCDKVDGPIIKLKNGTVRKLNNLEDAKKIYSEIDEIIYLGDILFPFSDVANRNANLLKSGYVEEWWKLDLRKKDFEFEKSVDCFNVNFEKAFEISKKYKIALHPNYIFYWNEISKEEFLGLIEWLNYSRLDKKIIFPYSKNDQERFSLGKRALELLGMEHQVTIENVVIDEETSKSFFVNLGIDLDFLKKGDVLFKEVVGFEKFNCEELKKEEVSVLDFVNSVSDFEIKDKSGDFIGSRMGRPEKAKLRKLVGSPNVLFPVGKEGGRLRSLQAALEKGFVRGEFPNYYCNECNKETIYRICEKCNSKTEKVFYCRECKESFKGKKCSEHGGNLYSYQNLDINSYFQDALKKLDLNKNEIPVLIKGIRGTSSENHVMENLAKGIVRSIFNLQVNKDGTIRFDATELPLTYFKPKEIFASVKKLKSLGYEKDIYGKELEDENQILEMMPHDIVIPCSPESGEEKADDVFLRVSHFVDCLLERFYNLDKFYNLKSREDLIGKLGVCMAPHNCAGVICRIIGFSNTQGLLASPYMHAAIRRDCDGDEAAIMLLMDVLLNFSKEYLPGHRGGTQDAPLVLNAKIDAGEVDDQILDFEAVNEYPLELYEKSLERKHSSEIEIPTVKSLLKEDKNPFLNLGFTHNTNNFNDGVLCSSYKKLGTMQEKVEHQMKLVEKLRAANTSDTARLIIERHFIRDLRGNLRKFSMQGFRCVDCNEILRRPPLSGICPKCRGKIIFTIHEGGIKKYLEPALDLVTKYELSRYIKQSLELTKRFIEEVFGRELEKQEALEKWF